MTITDPIMSVLLLPLLVFILGEIMVLRCELQNFAEPDMKRLTYAWMLMRYGIGQTLKIFAVLYVIVDLLGPFVAAWIGPWMVVS